MNLFTGLHHHCEKQLIALVDRNFPGLGPFGIEYTDTLSPTLKKNIACMCLSLSLYLSLCAILSSPDNMMA